MSSENVTVTEADYVAAEEITSAANIVSHDGYYEIDTDSVAVVVAKHRLTATRELEARVAEMEAEKERLRKALQRLSGGRSSVTECAVIARRALEGTNNGN